MGIYDRDYYRGEGPSYLDRLLPSGVVCKWLIIINVVVFFVQVATQSNPTFTDALVLKKSEVMEGQVWRLITFAFLHDVVSIWHILFNMLFLWWFGSDIEERYGSKEFLAFYLVATVVSGLAYVGHAALAHMNNGCLGASGGVTAVLVLYAFHNPRATILIFLVLPVPIWFFVIFQVAQDTLQLFGPVSTDVAVAAHLGGAAFAALYYQFDWRILNVWQGLKNWRRNVSRPRLKIYRPETDKEPVSVAAPTAPALDEHLEAKLDAVLEKVARQGGTGSLTDQERQILLRASEIYKKRRN